jgi:hypothetical protein
MEARKMVVSEKPHVSLFVDKSRPEHWIVLDPDGKLWALPPVDSPWDSRWPFVPTEETDLELIPGHYKHMLGLPF